LPSAAFTTKVSPLLGCTVGLEKGLFAVFTIAEEKGNFLYFQSRPFFLFGLADDKTLLGFGFKTDILNMFLCKKIT
jgi:hypothetical protein